MTVTTIGIDIGSTNVKICCLGDSDNDDNGGPGRHAILAHEGNLDAALGQIFRDLEIDDGLRAVVTGTEGRHRVNLPEVIAPVAVEKALAALGLRPRAVVSMGGEDLVVHVLDARGGIVSTYSGNKCASGTGEFFRQQLGRMNLKLRDIDEVSIGARVHKLSARCSVFMKSDCTHRLNKGEATKGDIVLSLSKLMADKVSEYLTKARITNGQVVLTGGVTLNRFLVRFLREAWPGIDFVIPAQAPFFEAFGAAHLACDQGAEFRATDIVAGGNTITFDTFVDLKSSEHLVTYAPSIRGEFDPAAEYILGVDGGSTTTKVALVNAETLEIVAEHYGRTHGDPVAAVKECLRIVKAQLGGHKPRISLVATTGSSRELLGVFLETAGVYNEIVAHTVGTTFFEPAVDTIFEIGGQDAKYVFINNGVPIDYAMNEACSAGTGSFLEESARGDLNIETAPEIGPVALAAREPLKFGEHCSAFINSDIRKGISQGAAREDIVAGLIFSIVANYLNRVVGNRRVGDHIVLQGGVAKNPAVPLAFARMLDKKIVVPPDPELMGCFGVALLALKKSEEGRLARCDFDLDAIMANEIVYKNEFQCKACDNWCGIRNLEVAGRRYPFGGRCSKYTNQRKKRQIDEEKAVDYGLVRSRMLFEDFAPKPGDLKPRTDVVVGIPRAFSVHTLWPFYAWFFHHLGVRVILSETVDPEGIARQESNYCFPAEIAHGAIQELLKREVDYLFLPHFRDMPSMEKGPIHACTCPLTQGLPYYARQAFKLEDERILRPVVAFKHGWDYARPNFEEVAVRLGFSREDGAMAYNKGVHEQRLFLHAYRQLGDKVLAEIEANPDRIYVALLGRPYNAFTRDANMGIPRKFTSQGVSLVPFDMFFDPEAEIYPFMYWFYGQQNMKAVRRVEQIPNLYLTWISNFSCAPDSFMLHYVRWMMGQKPYLILEIDSHSADAGLDTRVEAFLDIVDSFRHAELPPPPVRTKSRYSIVPKDEYCDVIDHATDERMDIRDPRITMMWPSMGDLAVRLATEAAKRQGIKSIPLPIPTVRSTQLARNVASGKECIPALLVLGTYLQYFQEHPVNQPGEIYLAFVPVTYGPCRTGQYHVFYERIFQDLGWENVVVLTGSSENSYREFGPTFSQDVWRCIVISDYLTDVQVGIRLLAADVDQGLRVYDRICNRMLEAMAVGSKEVDRALKEAGRELATIPKRRTLADIKKVMIVGEMYVRRDDFSIKEVVDFLVSKDIYPKLSSIAEWIHYTDFARKYLMTVKRAREGLLKVIKDGDLKTEAWERVESVWKANVERKVRKALFTSGFVPDVPHDMDRIIAEASDTFVHPELESEACVSPAVAHAAMKDGFSGIGIIAPFGCLPGRVIEGVVTPWAKAKGYPVLALENDGLPYPPNVIARMEVFAHNVGRFYNGNGNGNGVGTSGWARTRHKAEQMLAQVFQARGTD